jgi:uncharacterized repeat protein (TIGR01451 family)
VDNILGNQASTTLTNRFEVKYQDAFSGQQVSSPAGPSGLVNVHIVEPKLTLTKTANPTSVGPGGTVTYTVTITNTGTATAFDVVFTDTLPAGLTLVPGSVTPSCSGFVIGAGINVTCPQVPVAPAPGSTVTITYQATVSTTVPCNTTLTNSAKVTWTSLPGPKGTVNNPTGSSTVGNSGAIDGERDGSDGLLNSGVLNDYQVQASATITVVCVCDLAIKKTVTPTPTALLLVTVTLTVPAGQTCAPGTVVVGDQQPSGMTFGLPGSLVVTPASDWNCSATTSSNLSCTNTTTLTGAYTATFTFNATVQPGITITNCATATVSGTLISQSCVTFSIPKAQCDLKIEKFTDPAQPVAGQPFAFVVKVTNVGKGPCAPTTTVTDNLPIGFMVTSFNPNTADGWTCPSGPPGSPNIVCNNTTLTLQPGQNSMVFAVVGTFTVGAGVTNCAELQNQNDTDSSNNKACVTVMFVQPPKCDLAIKKTVDPNPPVAGQPFAFTVTVTNVGTGPCPPTTTVTDNLPSGFNVTLFNPNTGAGWVCTNPPNITCTNATLTLQPGQSSMVFAVVGILGIPPPPIENCAELKNPNDTNPNNNKDCIKVTVVGKCDLKITKTVQPNPVPSGQQVTVTLTVQNVGTGTCPPGPFPGTVVSDPKPSGLTFNLPVSISQSGGSATWQCGLGVPTGDLSCATQDPLPPGYSATFTFTATVTAPPGSNIQNCATVSNQNDANPANNKSCVTITVTGGVCDREIKKTVTPNPVQSGGTVTITLTVTNVGTAACPVVPGINVADPQPSGLTFQPPVSANKPGWSCGFSGPGVIAFCTSTSPLLPGPANAVTITFTAKVTASPGSQIQNCAEVTNVGDAVQTNNQSCVTINVIGLPPPPDLALAKLLDGQLRVEKEATYVLRVTNGGGGPTSGPIVVSDPLPAGLRFVSASGPGWSCSAEGQNVTCRNAGPIQPGQTSTILLRVRVAAPAGTQITNCATVETAGDANPANNRACHTSTVQR